MSKSLVSIVMPAFNEEILIVESIGSVINQTYQDWELIIVDDCSTDDTANVINEFSSKDKRIKYFKMDKNSGAALSRNLGVREAKGTYLAFLDSDDVWRPDKLSKQIGFMETNSVNFSCTSYDKIDEKGKEIDEIILAEPVSDYNKLLKKCPGNSTVIYNAKELGKFEIPNIKKRNDYVMWLQVIKKSEKLYGLEEILSSHRIVEGSLSSNKFDLVKYHWIVYRDIEKLSLMKSVYLIVYWSLATVFKLRKGRK